MTYRFGPFEADRTTYRVTRDAAVVPLTPKLLDLLFHLVERAGTLVTKEELLEAVWPGANVTDNALAQGISELREALGDRPADAVYIKTVARRGYRFVAPVEVLASPASSSPAGSSPSSPAGSSPARSSVPGASVPGASVPSASVPGAPDSRSSVPGASPPGASAGGAAVGRAPASTGTAELTPSASGDAALPAAGSVAVLEFDNLTGDPEIAWLSAGIAETVTGDLAALDRFRVIDRWTVVQTGRRLGRPLDLEDAAARLGARLAVTGGFQRAGAALRINARVVDLVTGETRAEAKVDGAIEDVFALQDAVVATLSRGLGVPASGRAGRGAGRETASLDAYRAYTEGWLKIESLDTDLVAASIADFERAVSLDRRYALAHTGLANAAFVAYEMTRTRRSPDLGALAAGIEHARRAIDLDPALAEAHATLSFLLVSQASFREAREAAARAVELEPDSWRHQYRLGHASWGTARLRALERAVAFYPQFPYAHFEATMVHVARGHLEAAEDIARVQVVEQDRQARSGQRFPAIGFHWLLGALAARAERWDEAATHFDRELAQVDPRRLYGPEYGALASIGQGQVELARGRDSAAVIAFRDARAHVPGHGRAHLGEAVALTRLGERTAAEAAWAEVEAARQDLDRTGRRHEALHLEACADAMRGDLARAVDHLEAVLSGAPPSFHGWTIPIEPFLRPLAENPGFLAVLARLADQAG